MLGVKKAIAKYPPDIVIIPDAREQWASIVFKVLVPGVKIVAFSKVGFYSTGICGELYETALKAVVEGKEIKGEMILEKLCDICICSTEHEVRVLNRKKASKQVVVYNL